MKKLIPILLSLFFCSVQAQNDSIYKMTKWYVPDYAKLQFAGQMGFLSAGVGSEIFKSRRGELDLMLGYLPESVGGDEIFTSGIKFQYLPWEKPVFNSGFKWQPLSFGVVLFHAWGRDLNRIRDKDLYPRGYYWWSLGTRIGPVIGTRLKKYFKADSGIKSASFYMEFVTNDLYIYSWGVNDDIIPLWAIFDVSFGLRIHW